MEPTVEIPNRAAFKASEVCEIARIPAYVLRSWEKEFPALGMAAKPGGPRIYRRSDVEQILRIRQLVFTEGLTLAGARRKIEGEPPPDDDVLPQLLATDEVRARVTKVKTELRSLLALLSAPETRSGPPNASASVPPNETAVAQASTRAAPAARRVPAGTSSVLPLLEGLPDTPPSRHRHGPRRAVEARAVRGASGIE